MALRILIVDDSPVTRAMISDFLQMVGHQVVAEAENMTQALQAREAHKPELITLDLSLGAEDGFDVLRAVRKLDAAVKVLIVSANTQQEIYDDLMKEGANGILVKPFSVADLAAAVDKAAKA